MHEYTDSYSQAAAFVAAGSSDSIERHGNSKKSLSTDSDWIGVTLLSLAVGCMCIRSYQPESGIFSHQGAQLVRTAFAIAYRIATDLARFVLSVLAIKAELLLHGTNTVWAALHRIGTEISKLIADFLYPVATTIWTSYDAVYHGHHANVARQRFNHARTFAGLAICWAIIIDAVLRLFVIPSVGTSASLEDYDIQPYVVPAWVVKARPENRPHDGSSSHFQPACVDAGDTQEHDLYAPTSTNLRSTDNSDQHRAHPESGTLTPIAAETGFPELDLLAEEITVV
jgi:hypothetical protein